MESIAESAYRQYCVSTGGYMVGYRPVVPWTELAPEVQDAWYQVVEQVVERVIEVVADEHGGPCDASAEG